MAPEPLEWKEITPEGLIPAIKHIRESFEESEWKCGTVTEKLCYSALHPQVSDRAPLLPYESAFAVYRKILGPVAVREFDSVLRIGTASAVFKAYFDAFRKGMEIEVERVFDEILSIGRANSRALKTHPVEWAKTHSKILIGKNLPVVARWIKTVCDQQVSEKPVETTEDFTALIFWKDWRAPRLIYMQPSGNARHDPANAWTREGELRTQELLNSFSRSFSQFLEIQLDKIAGAAHVESAKRGEFKAQEKQSPARPADSGRSPESEQPASQSNKKPAPEKKALGPKLTNLSHHWDSANLTERQRECMSLHYEYSMRKTDVARRLGIDRKTLDEHLAAGASRLAAHSAKQRADKRFARVKPGGL
jgi:predicted DNA-binding protein (UPF0251 family)